MSAEGWRTTCCCGSWRWPTAARTTDMFVQLAWVTAGHGEPELSSAKVRDVVSAGDFFALSGRPVAHHF